MRYADDCNIYMGNQATAQRVLASITQWLSQHLRLEIKASKSGIGRPWERKFLGFRIDPAGKIEVAPRSLDRFQDRGRELWRSCESRSSKELKDRWRAYLKGWWNYFCLAEERRNLHDLEGWIHRHMRACFWLRWHHRRGRLRALGRLGLRGRHLKWRTALKGHGASPPVPVCMWRCPTRCSDRYGLLVSSDLAAT